MVAMQTTTRRGADEEEQYSREKEGAIEATD
jgi:hypothetical protein